MATVFWFRRDLRLNDNPALNAAIEESLSQDKNVVPLFIIDPKVFDSASDKQKSYQNCSLKSLNKSLDEKLLIRHGNPEQIVLEVALAAKAKSVHISEDFEPYGRKRDNKVETILSAQGINLIRTGSPYAVSPLRVRKDDGTPYRVFTPFYKVWNAHGWRKPAAPVRQKPNWIQPTKNQGLVKLKNEIEIASCGEDYAQQTLENFMNSGINGYQENRNRPDLLGTSKLSLALRFGEIHPRTILAELGENSDHETFRKEICWREFYADVLAHNPDSENVSLDQRWEKMGWGNAKTHSQELKKWQQGLTGYPIVDAGMRQLIETGWMHNRLRMIVGSFLVKDLHIHWNEGAKWFMKHLIDGDIASNSHGWQWVAGCGTDAAPYFRIFNPITQALKFDPNGDYVRTWIKELRHIPGAAVHEPWNHPDGFKNKYPQPMVDHATERDFALAMYEKIKKT
jgi:deoxyribodipyrimidine photo-lyase